MGAVPLEPLVLRHAQQRTERVLHLLARMALFMEDARMTTPSTPPVADDVPESGEAKPVAYITADGEVLAIDDGGLKAMFAAIPDPPVGRNLMPLYASPSPQHIGDAGGVEPTYWHNGAGQVMTHASREALRGTTDEDMLGRFDEPLYALPPARVEAEETQESIGAWADEVFGPVSDLPRAVGRAGEELAELKEAAETLTPQDMIVEMADVVIVLMRLANVIGQDLGAAINAKMAINRKRTWNSDGTGHGYHVKPALQSEPK